MSFLHLTDPHLVLLSAASTRRRRPHRAARTPQGRRSQGRSRQARRRPRGPELGLSSGPQGTLGATLWPAPAQVPAPRSAHPGRRLPDAGEGLWWSLDGDEATAAGGCARRTGGALRDGCAEIPDYSRHPTDPALAGSDPYGLRPRGWLRVGRSRYRSLSTIAKAITGTSWNGWTFFGVKRGKAVMDETSWVGSGAGPVQTA